MITDTLARISTIAVLSLTTQLAQPQLEPKVLSSHQISLDDRYPIKEVSDVFKDNILLNMAYFKAEVKDKNFSWDEVRKPFTYEFKLEPGKTFAFHEDILDQYKGKVTKTTNAHFNSQEGFKTDGYLFGDGVCHLASLIYWAAKDANLEANAPTPHDFMSIPDISKEFGVSIYSNPFSKSSNPQQNLYITNNKGKLITFKFEYNDDNLRVSVTE